jgi:hypothetical protein
MNTVRSFVERILELPTHFFVDIGASDCPGESQTEILLEHGWSGVMFECDPVKFKGLSARMAGKSVQVFQDKVTVDNILQYLKTANVPTDFYLSIDIDGYDYFVLREILKEYKPQLIVSEINEKIPPPIKFTVMYDPTYWWRGWHHFGYSLSMLEDLLPEFGYKIMELDYNNVILVPGTQTESLKDVYWNGYLGKPDKDARFYYNTDFGPIYKLPVDEQIAFINRKFKDYQGQYTINGRFQIDDDGQVKRSTSFGKVISQYAADLRFTNYVEIGTWNGNGTTCCFYDGFCNRASPAHLKSYEINKDRVANASRLWKLVNDIEIIHGRILPNSECPVYYEASKRFKTINKDWYTEDITNFWNAPYVPLETTVDVVCLDGSEYLTDYEFMKLEQREDIQVFLLRCTLTNKCAFAYRTLIASPKWKLIVSEEDENGWAVFERITSSSEQTPETPAHQQQ